MCERSLRRMVVAAMVVMLGAATCVVATRYQPARAASLERFAFVLGGGRHAIMMPKHARLGRNAPPNCVRLWHPRANRLMIFLELCAGSRTAPGKFTREKEFTNGAQLRYAIDESVGGGSGGTEAELVGELNLNGELFSVICRDQNEWGADPTWCLSYLPYLEALE